MLPDRGISTDLSDRGYRGRIGIAFAAALAIHEIVAGLWPSSPPAERVQQRVAQEIVSITKRPPPTPRPTPVPTPKITPAPHYTLAPKFEVRAPAARAAATPHAAIGGAAAPKHVAIVKPKPVAPQPKQPESLVAGAHLGQQNGGTGTGAGPGNGTSGLGGTGSGNGTAGNGNGGDTNSAPCGQVLLIPGRVDYRPDGTVLQHVIAKVILRDGDVQLGTFPYPFVYSAERLNPFAHDDQLAADKGIRVQQPPADSDVGTMPAPVQVVLKYTSTATGFTTLPDCGDASPLPEQQPSP